MEPSRALPIGEMLDQAFADALESWTRTHKGILEPEVFRSREFISSTLTVQLVINRPVYLYIEITARRPWQSETYGYELRSGGKRDRDRRLSRIL